MPDLLRARVEASPDEPFLHWQDRTWSYAEALNECERFAGFLHHSGLAGGRVAGYTANRPEAVWAWLRRRSPVEPTFRSTAHTAARYSKTCCDAPVRASSIPTRPMTTSSSRSSPRSLKTTLVAGCDPGVVPPAAITYEAVLAAGPWAGHRAGPNSSAW